MDNGIVFKQRTSVDQLISAKRVHCYVSGDISGATDVPRSTYNTRRSGSSPIIIYNAEQQMALDNERRKKIRNDRAFIEIRKFFLAQRLQAIQKQIDEQAISALSSTVEKEVHPIHNASARLSSFMQAVNSKSVVPLEAFLQCSPSDVNMLFSIWVFLTRFSNLLSIESLDLEEFCSGMLLYGGNTRIKLSKPRRSYLHLIDSIGMKLVTFLFSNESDLPILVDESPGVSHIISSHEALLKFVSEFESVRSGLAEQNWMFVLVAVLLLHSPSQTSLFDHVIVDLCEVLLSNEHTLIPFKTLLQLFAETINLVSLTNPIRDSLMKTINPLTGEITTRGRPRLASKKKVSAAEFFRLEVSRISHLVEKLPEERKRRVQNEKPIMTKPQKEWVYLLTRELTYLLPCFIEGSILELARFMDLDTHPVILELNRLIEECRTNQKTEEFRKSCRLVDFQQVRQFYPTLSTPFADYFFISSYPNHAFIRTTKIQLPGEIDQIQGCNHNVLNRLQQSARPYYEWFVVLSRDALLDLAAEENSHDKQMIQLVSEECFCGKKRESEGENGDKMDETADVDGDDANLKCEAKEADAANSIDPSITSHNEVDECDEDSRIWSEITANLNRIAELLQTKCDIEDKIETKGVDAFRQLMDYLKIWNSKNHLGIFKSVRTFDIFCDLSTYCLSPRSIEMMTCVLVTAMEVMEKRIQVVRRKPNQKIPNQICDKCGIGGRCFQCQKCGLILDSRCGKFTNHICKYCRSKMGTIPEICMICQTSKNLTKCDGCSHFFHQSCSAGKSPKWCDRCLALLHKHSGFVLKKEGVMCHICEKPGVVAKCTSCDRFFHSVCLDFRTIKGKWHCAHCATATCPLCKELLHNGQKLVQCNNRRKNCGRWFHLNCVSVKRGGKSFMCNDCKNQLGKG